MEKPSVEIHRTFQMYQFLYMQDKVDPTLLSAAMEDLKDLRNDMIHSNTFGLGLVVAYQTVA